MIFRKVVGTLIAGFSIATALAVAMPQDQLFTWPWWVAMIVAAFGTTIGDRIYNGQPELSD